MKQAVCEAIDRNGHEIIALGDTVTRYAEARLASWLNEQRGGGAFAR